MPKYLSDFLPNFNSNAILPNRGGYTATMRESSNSERVLIELKEMSFNSDTKKKLHVGWGSYRNLDIIVATKCDYGIICDVSLRQIDLWSKTFSAILLSSTPNDFIETISEILPKNPRPRYFGNSLEEWLKKSQKDLESWLSEQKKFDYIKNLVKKDRIQLICCDIREQDTLHKKSTISELIQSINKLQKKNICYPYTLYLTNLPWMMKNEKGFFGENHNLSINNDLGSLGFEYTLNNLKILSPLFKKIISAHKLAHDSKIDNLQWETNIYSSESLIKELEYEK